MQKLSEELQRLATVCAELGESDIAAAADVHPSLKQLRCVCVLCTCVCVCVGGVRMHVCVCVWMYATEHPFPLRLRYANTPRLMYTFAVHPLMCCLRSHGLPPRGI